MAWITYKTWDYNDGANSYLEKCDFFVQYDDTSVTPTTLKIRFGITGTNGYYIDSCHFLYNPDFGNGTLYKCKDSKATSYPYYTSSITLTKSYTASSFTLKPFWACNNGNNAVYVDAATFKTCFAPTGSRRNWAHRVTTETTMSVPGTVASSVTAYTPIIKDNYDGDGSTYFGSCRIVGRAGTNGNYNNVNSTTLQYKIDSGGWINATSLTIEPLKLTSTGTSNIQTIKARTVVDGVYNDQTSGENTLNVRRYKAPSTPSVPVLTDSSFKNKRLTVKLPWTFTWNTSNPGVGTGTTNGTDGDKTTSKVLGYRFYMEKRRGTGSWTAVKLGTSTNYLITSTNSIEINPLDYSIKAKDSIRVKVSAYTKTGKNNTGTVLESSCSDWGAGSAKSILVQNAGVMRVKPTKTSGWKEGVVWVKVRKNNVVQWVEADIVQVKVNTSSTSTKKLEWKESN